MIKPLLIAGLVSLFAVPAPAREESLLARVTVYWRTGIPKCDCAHATGAGLRAGHCAVDPKKIPYGSKVIFPDGPCVAVDTGPAVVDRKAARLSGRNGRQRDALVIDRFFETKQEALAWERAHPHFMTVRVVPPHSHPEPIEPVQTNSVQVAQATAPQIEPWQTTAVQVAQATAPLPVVWPQNHSSLRVAFKTPARQLISAPPSYHRRWFATEESDEVVLPPLDRTARPVRRSPFV